MFKFIFIVFICIFWSKGAQSFVLQIGDNCGSYIVENEREDALNQSSEVSPPPPPSCDPSIPLECLHGRCQCKRGYTINRNGTQCLEIARNGLESPCAESIQCWKGLLGRLSECNTLIGKCQCYDSESLPIVFHLGRCYYGESLGDYCQIEGLCSATTVNATCKTGLCQCKDGYASSWDKSRCIQIAINGLNSSCEENIQCEKSQLGTLSECNQESMRCQCYKIPMVPTVFHSGRCYFGASLGDVCQVTAQCLARTENSVCGGDGKCRCNETAFVPNALGSACLPIVSADDGSTSECIEDSQCTRTLGHFSRCDAETRKCECFSPEEISLQSLYIQHHQRKHLRQKKEKEETQTKMIIVGAKCYSTKKLGEECKYNQQCSALIKKSICVNESCSCEAESHVTSLDGKKCLEIGMDGLGSSCEEDMQCTQSILGLLSRCDPMTKNCTCSSILPVVYYNKACFFHRQVGTPCDSHPECKAAGNSLANCINGRCQCGEGTKVDGQACVPITSEFTSGVRSMDTPWGLMSLYLMTLYLKRQT